MADSRIFVFDAQLARTLNDLVPSSLEVTFTPTGGGYTARILEQNGRLSLQVVDDQRVLTEVANDESGYEAIFQALHGWQHWQHVWVLDTDEGDTPVQLELYPHGEETAHPGESWTVEIWEEDQRIPFAAKARNRSAHPQFLHLLYLTDTGGIQVVPVPEADKPLLPGETRELLKARAYLSHPDQTHQVERLVAIGSSLPLDFSSWQQESFQQPAVHPMKVALGSRRVSRYAVHVVRGQGQVGTESFSIANGALEVQGHPELKVSIGLSNTGPSTRSLRSGARGKMISTLIQDMPGVEMVSLSPNTRSLQGAPDTLEISGIDDTVRRQAKERPLVVNIQQPLAEREAMIPFAFDGEFLLPAGRALRNEDGRIRMELDYFPEPEVRTKSLMQALKFYFFKAAFSRPTLQIQRVDFQEDGTIERTEDGVDEAVKKANTILLVIHGIIGNTEEMAESVAFAVKEGLYDLILTVDYENLATPISETAQRLKERLLSMGADSKQIDIMAHSMGGLVSRWMIEREGGHAFIRRLLMLGTPNGGSAFSMLAPVIPALVGVAANLKSPIVGSLIFAMQWLNDRNRINRTLNDMDKDSNMLLELNTSEAVKTPYAIIGGNVLGYESTAEGWFGRLMDKVMAGVGNLVYRKEPNDIAVSVPGIFHLPHGKTAFEHLLPTHHLIYFSHKPSVEMIQEFLRSASWQQLAMKGVLKNENMA